MPMTAASAAGCGTDPSRRNHGSHAGAGDCVQLHWGQHVSVPAERRVYDLELPLLGSVLEMHCPTVTRMHGLDHRIFHACGEGWGQHCCNIKGDCNKVAIGTDTWFVRLAESWESSAGRLAMSRWDASQSQKLFIRTKTPHSGTSDYHPVGDACISPVPATP